MHSFQNNPSSMTSDLAPHSTVINFKSLLQPRQKYNITQYEELGFSSLPQGKKMITLNSHYTLIHFSLLGWENVLFELGK